MIYSICCFEVSADDFPTTTGYRDDDHIASDLFNIHENDREIKPDVYVSKTPRVEGFPKSFKKIGRTIPGPN